MDLKPLGLLDPGPDSQARNGGDPRGASIGPFLGSGPPGANHFFIQSVEAGPHPESGLPAADRLREYAPAAGHLVHIPSHVYLRVGQYHDAAEANCLAAKADWDYIRHFRALGFYPGFIIPTICTSCGGRRCLRGADGMCCGPPARRRNTPSTMPVDREGAGGAPSAAPALADPGAIRPVGRVAGGAASGGHP